MALALAQAEQRFGSLHGVIHAAGSLESLPIHKMTAQEVEVAFKPKIQGLCVLDKVIGGRPLDFCLLVSSLSAVLGGLGYGAYAAANAFMDAFALHRNRASNTRWSAIDWDAWRSDKQGAVERPMASEEVLGMTISESQSAFGRILARDIPASMVVSTGDLKARIDRWINLRVLAKPEPSDAKISSLQPRPNLSVAYAAPRSRAEQVVAQVWQDLLGMDRVGINDDFFEIGGHSLLAIQILSRLREEFELDLPANILFEHPTVAGLVEALHRKQTEYVEEGTLRQILQEITELSEQEIDSQLAQEGQRMLKTKAE
jgi:acyl carrier protein